MSRSDPGSNPGRPLLLAALDEDGSAGSADTDDQDLEGFCGEDGRSSCGAGDAAGAGARLQHHEATDVLGRGPGEGQAGQQAGGGGPYWRRGTHGGAAYGLAAGQGQEEGHGQRRQGPGMGRGRVPGTSPAPSSMSNSEAVIFQMDDLLAQVGSQQHNMQHREQLLLLQQHHRLQQQQQQRGQGHDRQGQGQGAGGQQEGASQQGSGQRELGARGAHSPERGPDQPHGRWP